MILRLGASQMTFAIFSKSDFAFLEKPTNEQTTNDGMGTCCDLLRASLGIHADALLSDHNSTPCTQP
jgi:hypothetical protein